MPSQGLDHDGVRVVAEDDSMQPHTDPEMVMEHRDSDEALLANVKRLAKLVGRSKRVVVMTGAGVSTATGIPDYRGPDGKWTLVQRLEQSTDDDERAQLRERIDDVDRRYGDGVLHAVPSKAHMALVALQRAGLVHSVITTNVDGLHLKSGLPAKSLHELHGNSVKLRCPVCSRLAMSDCVALASGDGLGSFSAGGAGHITQYPCMDRNCGGVLCDTFVHFGEELQPEVQRAADESSAAVDCLICLGTSLRIISCSAVMDVGYTQGKFVIVNLQRTEYDHLCALRVFHECDAVMTGLCAALNVPLAPWRLSRLLRLELVEGIEGEPALWITASTIDDVAFCCHARFEVVETATQVVKSAAKMTGVAPFHPDRVRPWDPLALLLPSVPRASMLSSHELRISGQSDGLPQRLGIPLEICLRGGNAATIRVDWTPSRPPHVGGTDAAPAEWCVVDASGL